MLKTFLLPTPFLQEELGLLHLKGDHRWTLAAAMGLVAHTVTGWAQRLAAGSIISKELGEVLHSVLVREPCEDEIFQVTSALKLTIRVGLTVTAAFRDASLAGITGRGVPLAVSKAKLKLNLKGPTLLTLPSLSPLQCCLAMAGPLLLMAHSWAVHRKRLVVSGGAVAMSYYSGFALGLAAAGSGS